MLDPKIMELAQAKNYGTISVRLPSGDIATHVMWVDATAEHVLINTEVHRAKYKAIEKDPTVTVMIWDLANPYRYAEVRGTVAAEVRGAEALAHINALSHKYNGGDYPNAIVSERVILKIEPRRQRHSL